MTLLRRPTLAWLPCLALLLCLSSNGLAQLMDGKEALPGYPKITMLIEVKDARKASELIKKAGGKIVYDPNLGIGHDIPFLVVELPGEKVVDEKFLKSLELKSGVSPFPDDCGCKPRQDPEFATLNFDSLFVPIEDIELPKLRERDPGEGLGRGIRVAVIDTGVDASHPVFQDRVIYWSDATQEGRIKLEKVRIIEGKVTFQDKSLTVPKRIADNKEIFVGVFDEQAMGIQLSDSYKSGDRQGLDFNRNASVKDRFLVMIGRDQIADPKDDQDQDDEGKDEAGDKDKDKDDGREEDQDDDAAADGEEDQDDQDDEDDETEKNGQEKDKEEDGGEDEKDNDAPPKKTDSSKAPLIAFMDTDGDGAIKDKEAETAILDFNQARQQPRDDKLPEGSDLAVFPSRTRTIAYPLLFRADSKGVVGYATLGVDFRAHGTHVAGIIAGNGDEIQGAAPEAEIMALKACSGISCTDAAILRAVLEAFFNPQGYVPDVVNISLGSPEAYDKDRMDILIQDLSAKFGTVFFVSASNNGSGYRSINHLGSLSPAVLVGASVSKQTLAQHYRLQEGIEVPEQGLLHFTSLGPSYTGQLRPNIVAPGSALSSTPLIEEGSAMYNGTSMASPIAAGATAALLSLARRDKGFAKLEDWRKKKIEAIREKSQDAKYSLTSYAIGVRTALEESARELPGYTLAQQGHGLLDIDAAHDKLLEIAGEIESGKLRFAEFQVNGNSKSERLYDRSNNIPPVKRVALSLDEDGELSEAIRLRLRNVATEVRLDRVQIQAIDGTVQELGAEDANLPFSLALPGKEDAAGRALALVLSNRSKGSFHSVRHLEQMEPGKTYVAEYTISQRGQRLFTILDVVHLPIQLSDLRTEVNLPGIEVEESNRTGCFVNPGQAIAAMQHHRYPVAVTNRDSALNVEIGFAPEQSGMLLVQVYDPDGYLAGASPISKSARMPSERRTAKLVIPTLEKEGIYEVTVSSFSGHWVGPSAYELLLEAYRFVPSVERLELGTKRAGSGAPAVERIVSVMNSSRQVKTVTMQFRKSERIAPLKPFGIIPNSRTYKKLPLPVWDAKQGGSRNTTIVLELDPASDINQAFSGRIDHHLYRKTKDGKYESAYKAESSGASSRRKTFKNIPRPESGREADALYAAMEVFAVYPDGPSLSQLIDHVDMLVVYPDIAPRTEGSLKATLLSSDSTSDVKLWRLTAPDEILTETSKPSTRSSTATLKVETGDPNLPEISVQLPVKLSGPERPGNGPKSVELMRSVLELNTDHDGISVRIPIVIRQ